MSAPEPGPEVVLRHQSVTVHQLRTPELGDSTYIVTSGNEAAVIDPQRDVERCEALLDALGARLTAVLETHVHNDYVSGGPDLARRRSADYLVPRDSDCEGGRSVYEGDQIALGAVALRPLFTPGHTPHHLSYEIAAGGEVLAVLSGGSVLVGAVGRSDLISPDRTVELTRQQYRSAAKIGELPGPAVIGPTHGAGSFCTSSPASDATWTTVALEKERNPAFLILEEDEFVRRQLSGLGPYPAYYSQMAGINRSGARPWPPVAPEEFPAARLAESMKEPDLVVVDLRPRLDFARQHLAGAVNVELEGPFSAYLGWVFPWGTRFLLISSSQAEAQQAATQAARIGIDGVVGWSRPAGWAAAGLAVASYDSIPISELGPRLSRAGAQRVLDVRQASERETAMIPDSLHVPVQEIRAQAPALAAWEGTTFVHCASGYRAAIATSVLQAAGAEVVHVDGGLDQVQGTSS